MTLTSLPPPQVQLDWIPLPVENWFIASSRGRYMIKEGHGAEILRGAWIESGVMTKFMDAFLSRRAEPKPAGAIPDFTGLNEAAAGLAADATIAASVHPDQHFLAGLALRVHHSAKSQGANDIEAVSTVYHAGMAHIREAMGMPHNLSEAVFSLLPAPAIATTEALAQFIRTVDGDHSMGAASLAEAIVGWLSADPMARAELAGNPVPGVVWMNGAPSLVGDEQHWWKNRGARRLYLHADRPAVPEEVAAAVLAALLNAEPVVGIDGAQVGVSLKLAADDAEALRAAMLAQAEKPSC